MRSKWKPVFVPNVCFRKNFLELFRNDSLSKNKSKFKKGSRLLEDKTILIGFCKKLRIFIKLNGFCLQIWCGNKVHLVPVTSNMVKMFAGSFVFTKRFTREIHRKQIQSRQKKAFTKKK